MCNAGVDCGGGVIFVGSCSVVCDVGVDCGGGGVGCSDLQRDDCRS